MEKYSPAEDPRESAGTLAQYLASAFAAPELAPPTSAEPAAPVSVAFIDLQSATAGDDWAYINRVLALLPSAGPARPMPHLLVIDAVEGLETMVGEIDAYGQLRARRSRIAQIFRIAAKKCHLLFICEEKAAERLPEEFITDVVIRLRNRVSLDYVRRTIEVTKARGQWHVRGEHPYVIRIGQESTTVGYPHPDEPALPTAEENKQSYILAFPSLHARYRDVMVRSNPPAPGATPPKPFAAFGIEKLNQILSGGLPRGGVTALIGEEGTYKSRLARNFLSQCFLDHPGVTKRIRSEEAVLRGVGILLSVQDHITPPIARRLASHVGIAELDGKLEPDQEESLKGLEKDLKAGRLIYRRLEMHHLTSPILFHIVEAAVQVAQQTLRTIVEEDIRSNRIPLSGTTAQPVAERKRQTLNENMWRVRLVIDDWSLLNRTYPEVAQDPIFLPFLLFFLRRKGVTTLIVDIHPGDPETVKSIERDRDLPSQVERRLYVWRFPFRGEERVAIRAVPPLSALHPAPVRELRPAEGASRDEALEVDPEFELFDFSVLPHQPVPLEVRLHSEEPARNRPEVWSPVRKLFQELFRNHVSRGGRVVRIMDSARYEPFRDFCHLQGSARLDYTLVLQIDEFWSRSRTRSPLVDLKDYLGAPLNEGGQRSPSEEVFGTFSTKDKRFDAFGPVGYQLSENAKRIGRIPSMWDFGFLLCDVRAWDQAATRKVKYRDEFGKKKDVAVKLVWERLRVAGPKGDGKKEDGKKAPGHEAGKKDDSRKEDGQGPVSWRNFLAACRAVAEGADPHRH